jgi:membrane-associated protease RseP (regulator of RpoE activity)
MNRFIVAALATLILCCGVVQAQPSEPERKVKRTVTREVSRVVIKDGQVVTVDGAIHGLPPMGKRAWIGVQTIDLTPELRSHFSVPAGAGLMISRIMPGSPAERAAMKVGDILVSIDAKPIRTAADTNTALRDRKEGEVAQLEVIRNGARQRVAVTVAEREIRPIEIEEIVRSQQLRSALGEGARVEVYSSPELRARLTSIEECAAMKSRLQELETRLLELERRSRR